MCLHGTFCFRKANAISFFSFFCKFKKTTTFAISIKRTIPPPNCFHCPVHIPLNWWMMIVNHIKIGFNIHSVCIYKLNVSFELKKVSRKYANQANGFSIPILAMLLWYWGKRLQFIADEMECERTCYMLRTSKKSCCAFTWEVDSVNLQWKCAFFHWNCHLSCNCLRGIAFNCLLFAFCVHIVVR